MQEAIDIDEPKIVLRIMEQRQESMSRYTSNLQ